MPLELIVKHMIDDQTLAVVDGLLIDLVLKPCLEQNITKGCFSLGNGLSQTVQKPFQPASDFWSTALLLFQPGIIVLSFGFDLGRHAVIAVWHAVETCKGCVANGSGNAAIPILERVNGDKS